MAFQIRGEDGTALWAGGAYRDAQGSATTFAPDDVRFTAIAHLAFAGGTDIPVERGLAVRLPTSKRQWPINPCSTIQELDSRTAARSTGKVPPKLKAAAVISN